MRRLHIRCFHDHNALLMEEEEEEIYLDTNPCLQLGSSLKEAHLLLLPYFYDALFVGNGVARPTDEWSNRQMDNHYIYYGKYTSCWATTARWANIQQLGRIFGRKRQKLTGGWTKLRDKICITCTLC
jgi:hypothetical protein